MSRLIDADVIPYLYPVDDDGNDGDGMTLKSTIDEIPTVKAIPIEVVEQIRVEIEQEYNKFRNMSDKWDERACGLGTALEIIDKALKEQDE